ncbi:diacylglycerol kinase family lipid kinase [Agromyces atrinae]|uniref:Diacylglycerol kinase family lipid kinase n=1 Tax=Agromyces atrinae TaxID=592376 RepID=A0A4Q2M7R3_9MICO|nr:diacylglycerol kinase family protein [Agromyces atrinae]MCI2957172.1 diacylglycerol kinase family lipid kinase [Agromyces atrinae]NYD67471.1 YegS/Rv2252/BmrU family lipid kinase [Agromyces atrinae]RXZ88305.1 diacylglycerol kinase family lipid kinase [Agromyces atrinae]
MSAAEAPGEPASGAARKRAAIIFNPTKQGIAELRTAVAAVEKSAGWAESVWIETAADDPGKGMARDALTSGVDLVIAAGGDGTVRSVAAGLRDSGMPLGLVPQGTGNLLARNLGIPVNDQTAALRIAFSDSERSIDVITVAVTREGGATEQHVSLVMAGVGFDADMISNTNSDLKKRVGWLAYVDAGLRVLPASKPFRVFYRVDSEQSRRARVSTVLVANLGLLPGNIELIPDASIDDERLDIAILQPRGAFGWLRVFRRVAVQNQLSKSEIGRRWVELTGGKKRNEVIYLRGRRVSVEIDKPQQFEIDGDDFGAITTAVFEVDPGGLVVRVPSP